MPVAADPTSLQNVPLFQGLQPQPLRWLQERLHRRHFGPGAQILTAGEHGTYGFILTSGTVKVSMDRPDGTSVILAILGPGEIVGDMSLVDLLGHSETVVAIEETDALAIDEADFRASLRTIPGIAQNLATVLSRRLRLANEQLLAFGTLDVHGRVGRQILVLAREYGERVPGGTRIPIRLTQHDLADLVGASRVRVNQVLVQYKRDGAISVDSHYRITVHRPDALAEELL